MEPSNTRKAGAPSFDSKGKQTAQSASAMGGKDSQDESDYTDQSSEAEDADWDEDVDGIHPDDSASRPPDGRTKGSSEPRTYMEDADDDGNPIDDTRTYVSVVPSGAANVSRARNRTLYRGSSSLPNPTYLNSDSDSSTHPDSPLRKDPGKLGSTPRDKDKPLSKKMVTHRPVRPSAKSSKTLPRLHSSSVTKPQQAPRSVPRSVYMESAPVRPRVSSYNYNGAREPGPQGVARRSPPPAAYYGNTGYMPPNQNHFARPYWQHAPYEEGKEMMPYQMQNSFGPAPDAGSSPLALVRKKPRPSLKQSRKGKERPLSIHSLGAESQTDGPVADQGRPSEGSGKSANDAGVLRMPADVDAVYNSADARDLTVHLQLDLFTDVDDELEEFNRLARMGNFAAADSFFQSYLKEHMNSDPSIFVQYAEMLLEKGDFKSLLLLDGDSVFAGRVSPGRKDPEKSDSEELLEMNWMLLQAMALFHSQHKLHKLRVFCLGIRLARLAPARTIPPSLRERCLSDWADWKSIYRELLAEQRIWDFRDALITACVSYDTDQALIAFLDHASLIDGMVADWQTGAPDESTDMALLDMLSFIALNSDRSLEDGLAEDCLRLAEPIGNSLLDRFPHTVHSRPFIQWLVSKAVVENTPEQFAYLSDYAGVAICPKSAGALPYYIPIRQENPGWVPQDLTPAACDVLEATLKASRDMQDYRTETLCLNQLALGTKYPGAYFQQLGQLQMKQRDMAGYLGTCLTRYLICQDSDSKKILLEDLDSFGLWKDVSDLIIPTEAAARDVIQQALSTGSAKAAGPSILSASRYSSHLPEPFKSKIPHLPRTRFAETGEEPRPRTEIPRVEPHSESEDESEESAVNNTRSRNIHNGGTRMRNKTHAKDNHQPGFYPGPWTNYGMPPYYPMNMMYGAQPPVPTEAPQLPQPPPPATKEDKPNPLLEQLEKQLELLQAERKHHEEVKQYAEMESKIRKDAERDFQVRMEEMQRAQEEAKKEIELARIAAERFARARIEEERKAEAERQMQQAEMMAKAERDARDRLEKEMKEESERARLHAETMAEAEREAQKKYVAERALMEAEVRIQFAAELKAQEEARAAAEARAAEERARREVEDAVLRAEAVRAYEDKIAAEWEAGEERRRWEAELRAQGAREERDRMSAESRSDDDDGGGGGDDDDEEEEERGRRHSIS